MKKLFSFVVLAVAALAMVSCGKGMKVAEEMEKAVDAKDLTRLVALGDSVSALGDKAPDIEKAEAALCYAWTYKLVDAAKGNPESGFKGIEQFNDLNNAKAFIEKFVALFEAIKDKADAKELFEASKKGGVDIDALVNNAKSDLQKFAEMEAAPAEEVAEGAEEAAEEAVEGEDEEAVEE